MGRKTVYQAAYEHEYRASDSCGCVSTVCEENARMAAEQAVERHKEQARADNARYVRDHRKRRAVVGKILGDQGRKPITIYLNDADMKKLDALVRELNQTPDEYSRSLYIAMMLSLA